MAASDRGLGVNALINHAIEHYLTMTATAAEWPLRSEVEQRALAGMTQVEDLPAGRRGPVQEMLATTATMMDTGRRPAGGEAASGGRGGPHRLDDPGGWGCRAGGELVTTIDRATAPIYQASTATARPAVESAIATLAALVESGDREVATAAVIVEAAAIGHLGTGFTHRELRQLILDGLDPQAAGETPPNDHASGEGDGVVEIVRRAGAVEVRWPDRRVVVDLPPSGGVDDPVCFRSSGNEVEVRRSCSPFAAGCVVVSVAGWAHVDPSSQDLNHRSADGGVVYRSVRAGAALDEVSVLALIARLVVSLDNGHGAGAMAVER
jgi:hypothetical protein